MSMLYNHGTALKDLEFERQMLRRIGELKLDPQEITCHAQQHADGSKTVRAYRADKSLFAVAHFNMFGNLDRIEWSDEKLGRALVGTGLLGIARFPGRWEGAS